jgi:hypothetical protein
MEQANKEGRYRSKKEADRNMDRAGGRGLRALRYRPFTGGLSKKF